MYIYPDEDWRKFFNARRSSIILNLVVEPRKLVENCANRKVILKGQLLCSLSALAGFLGIEPTLKCSIFDVVDANWKKTAVSRFSLSKMCCLEAKGGKNSTNQSQCSVALMWNIEFLHLLIAVNNNEIKSR